MSYNGNTEERAPEPVAKPLQGLEAKGRDPHDHDHHYTGAGRDRHPPRPLLRGLRERAGSISAGTGRPLVLDRTSGRYFHLSCKPGAMRSGEFLDRMGAGL